MAGFDLNSLLNTKSKTAAVQEKQEEGPVKSKEKGFEVVMIDVEDLMPSKDNFYSTENIDELALSIELSGGIEQNLVVKPEAHGKHELIAGHRRRLAILKLINEGKEEYRKVPCRIKHETDDIKDKLSLIFTNSTARQLNDWEKVQQAKELKELLMQYKKALEEENKDKPKEEKERMGRVREIVAQMLNVSTTQVGRMEAIDNNLSQEFKEELQKGNINISTAHELSRKNEEEQAKAYEQYIEKGELHIKDVKEEPRGEITDEQIEQVQQAIIYAIKGQANRDIFKVKDKLEGIEKALKKHFGMTFEGSKFTTESGEQIIYRFAAEGLTIINAEWKNYLIEYADLAEIVQLMIENEILEYDDTVEEAKEEEETEEPGEQEETQKPFKGMNEPTAADEEEEQLPGQKDITDYKEALPEVEEEGLPFTQWIQKRYTTGQYNLIGKVIREAIMQEAENGNICPKEWEQRLTNALSVWVMEKTEEYKEYLTR